MWYYAIICVYTKPHSMFAGFPQVSAMNRWSLWDPKSPSDTQHLVPHFSLCFWLGSEQVPATGKSTGWPSLLK